MKQLQLGISICSAHIEDVWHAHVHRKKLIEALEQNDKDAIASFQTDQRGTLSSEQGATAGRDLTSQGNPSVPPA